MQVSHAFAEMIFKHGFVHCDPHAANMMVRPLPSSKWNIFGKLLNLHVIFPIWMEFILVLNKLELIYQFIWKYLRLQKLLFRELGYRDLSHRNSNVTLGNLNLVGFCHADLY